ncbi:DNA-directed RNA polymerase subunit beta [Frankliniella fusca]|uniref:DNA-directed RNA polymerase subunit beta n=1 Tax=Frankliniella fusca TaxID=407009 RepID=A0AAE1HXM8_9NEOP|nr:DNA-directed RNA polymerase subunit beta [Frankliniella fusca]
MTYTIQQSNCMRGFVKGAMGLRWDNVQYWQTERFALTAWELLTDIDDLEEEEAASWWDRFLARCNRKGFILVGPVAHRRSVLPAPPSRLVHPLS